MKCLSLIRVGSQIKQILIEFLNPSANPSNSISRNFLQSNAELPEPKKIGNSLERGKNKLTTYTFSNAWKFMEKDPNIVKIR
jgi:hypothetical protein